MHDQRFAIVKLTFEDVCALETRLGVRDEVRDRDTVRKARKARVRRGTAPLLRAAFS